jgi:1A family penicillin-binding protein
MENIEKLLLVIPELLIRIGDGVRYISQILWFIILKTYNYIISSVSSVHKQSVNWIQKIQVQKVAKQQALKKKMPVKKVPKPGGAKSKISGLVRLYRDAIVGAVTFFTPRIPKITFRLPRITFPRIHVPIMNIPKISLPQHIRLPTPKPKYPKYQRPITIYPVPLQIAWQIRSFVAGIFVTIVFLFIPYATHQWLQSLPNPKLLSNRDLEVTTKIFDRNGKLLYEIYADQNRTPIPLAQIPEVVQKATIAIEDKDFYKHQGFSIPGIIRALRETLFNHHVQGGSTISQQLIKSALLSPEITLSRKIKEIFLAVWAEQIYTKDEILEMYLNQVPYGGTAWGIESASQTYFGKSVAELSLAEAALLAGLPAAPSQYSPFGANPEMALERQHEVLRRMVEDHYITKDQADEAEGQPLVYAPPRTRINAPHFVMYIKDLLEKRYGARMVEHGGLRVKTSLDLDIQDLVQQTVERNITNLANLRVGNGASLVTNPKTGEILAMVGSKNYFDLSHDGNVNVTTSLRQPGSSIKVVNYAAALEDGFTAATILDDSPVVYHVAGSPAYAPVNYDGRFHGPTPLRLALGNSYNIPAVRTLAKIGVKTMIDKGRLMGISSWEDEERYGLSLTLGGGDVTMLEMANVFGSLANNGKRVDLMPILEVSDYTGKIIERNKPAKDVQAVNPGVAWIISNILSDNAARTQAFGPNSSLVIPGKTVSVKTGTSNEKRDNWTIGYTPSILTAVWVGNNDNSPMDPVLTSGITGAAPIWHDIMTELLKGKSDEVALKPENVISLPCYFGRQEYFVKGTEPSSGRCAPLPTPALTPTPTP